MSMEKTPNTPSTPNLKEALLALLNESVAVYTLLRTASFGIGERQRIGDIENSLERSVMRTLKDALRGLGDTETPATDAVDPAASRLAPTDLNLAMVDENIFAVTKQAAALRLRPDAPPELLEAFSALLNLLGASGHPDVANRMAELASVLSGLIRK